MKKQIRNLTLLSLIAGAACVPQQVDAMNIKVNVTEWVRKNFNDVLLKAVENDDIKTVQYCLDKGANMETKGERDFTPLLAASGYGYIELVKFFLEKDANREARSRLGKTPLILAALIGYDLDIIKILVEYGANIQAKDNNELTAYDHASQKGHNDIAQYLLDVQNEFNSFKNNPTKLTVSTIKAPLIPKVSKSTLLKILYKNNVFYIDTIHCLSMFEKLKKNKEFLKILSDCKFLQCNTLELKRLKKNGFLLTSDEFDMKSILSQHQKDSIFTDVIIE